MKYLCLVYLDERMRNALPKGESDAWIRQEMEYGETLRRSCRLLDAQALQSVQTATTLRVPNGKLVLSDGPSSETREQLAETILIHPRRINVLLIYRPANVSK